jgi:hypothetical protein
MEMTYTALERLLHRVAFATPQVQRAAADVEDGLFRRRVEDIASVPPLFVTALPRAGTTLLLEALAEFEEIATHTYRDMPFVAAPLLWDRLSAGFRKRASLKERAHADGVMIGYDSPEAFEEVLWRLLWPEKYHDDRIDLWDAADAAAAERAFLEAHFKKIVRLRAPAGAKARYASKNNANIARLDLLPTLFPGAAVVVPVRDPLEQATSLWRQHRRFRDLQAEHPFVAAYMADIGHYEFGRLHRPFAFDGFHEGRGSGDPDRPDYWLRYWIAAYGHVDAARGRVRPLGYERWCAEPRAELGALVEDVALPRGHAFERAVARVRPAPAARAEPASFDAALVERARDLHRSLVAV